MYCPDCYHTYTALRKAAADLETQKVHQMSTDRLEAAVKILTDLKGMQATINHALFAAIKKRLKQRDK